MNEFQSLVYIETSISDISSRARARARLLCIALAKQDGHFFVTGLCSMQSRIDFC